MCRCKALLSAGSIVLLIGASAPAAVEAELAGARSRMQATQADPALTRDADEQSDVLSRPVTLDLVDTPLNTALETIARLAGFTLAYNPDILPAGRTVTLNAAGLSARDALTRVLEGTGLEPTVIGTGQLTFVRRPDTPARTGDRAAAVAQQAVVTGTVTDEATGAALRGAQLRVDASELSTVTDAEGRYTLGDVPPGTHTLVARIIGYREGRQEVTVTAGTTTSVDFALAVSAVPLDEVVVTGTMVPTQMRAVPSPVSVITAEDIERRGLVRFEDILRAVPGVGVNTSGLTEYLADIHVRGASSLKTINTLKTYIDGVEVAQPIYVINQIDPGTIERIELIRGPQASTLYGSEAVAGVLQIFTKKGHRTSERARLQVRTSTGVLQSHYNDGLTPLHDHSVAITGGEANFSYSVTGTYKGTGEWVEDELIQDLGWDVHNSANNDLGFSSGLKYVVGPVAAEATIRTYRWSGWSPLPKQLMDAARNGTMNSVFYTKPNGVETTATSQTYGISLTYSPVASWQNTLAVGFDEASTESRRLHARLTTPADTFLSYQYQNWAKHSVSLRTALQMEPSAHLSATMQAGLDLSMYRERLAATQNATRLIGGLGNSTANLTRGQLSNHGFYVQVQAGWRDQIFLTAAMRGDRSSGFGDDYGYAWSPRVGLSHVLDFGEVALKSRIAVGTAVRPPDPSWKFGQVIGTTTTLGNDGLGPEEQSGYDTGLELYIGPNLSFIATYYSQNARDLISLVRLSDPPPEAQVVQNQNVGHIQNRGWELEGRLELSGFSIHAHYNWVKSTVKELSPTYTGTDFAVGEQPLGVPRNTAAITVAYNLQRGSVNLTLDHKGPWRMHKVIPYYNALFGTEPDREPYRGSFGDYIETYPAIQRYEVNARYRMSQRFTALLSIDNLLNSVDPARRDIDPVRGRQVLLGLRFASAM